MRWEWEGAVAVLIYGDQIFRDGHVYVEFETIVIGYLLLQGEGSLNYDRSAQL